MNRASQPLTARSRNLTWDSLVAACCTLTTLIALTESQAASASTASNASTASVPPTAAVAPWEKPRDITKFQTLLKHSPFSLPTAEASSPLADRYALTGIVSIGGEEQIFVFDRTDQSRERLTHTPNQKQMSLVSLVREGSAAPQKASIRVGADIGTISYMEAAPQQAAPVPAPGSVPGRPPGLRLPPLPQQPGVVTGPNPPGVITPPSPRRIIRRPMVNPPQAPSSAPAPTP